MKNHASTAEAIAPITTPTTIPAIAPEESFEEEEGGSGAGVGEREGDEIEVDTAEEDERVLKVESSLAMVVSTVLV